MVQEVVERLNNDDQPDFFELEEYDGDKESCSNVYIKCFDEPVPRSNVKDRSIVSTKKCHLYCSNKN